MISSKRILSLFVLPFVLAACSTESRKKKDFVQGRATDFDKAVGTTFRVDSVGVSDVQQVEFTYGLVTKKSFAFKACLQDATGAALQPDLAFNISDGNGGPVQRVTDFKGCLNWTEAHRFSLLSDETYFRMSRLISSANSHKGSVNAVFGFNPWNDSKAILDPRSASLPDNAPMIDIGPLAVSGARVVGRTFSPLKVSVESVAFEFQGIDWSQSEVTRDLHLTVAHKYLISVKPTVIRKTISKLGVSESLVGGKMKLYIALFRERDLKADSDLKNLVASSELIVSDDNNSGRFLAQTLVKFPNVADLSSRLQALVTLVPLSPIDGIDELRFSGVLKPGRLSSLTLVPSDQSARTVFEKNAPTRIAAHEKPYDAFVRSAGFQALDSSLVPGAELSSFFHRVNDIDAKGALLSLTTGTGDAKLSADAERALCVKLFASDDVRKRACLRDPKSSLSYGSREFIEEIESAPELLGTTTETMKMSFGISKSKTKATTSAHKLSAGAGLSVGLGIDSKGVSVGADGKTGPISLWSPVSWIVSTLLPSFGAKINGGYDYNWARTWTTADSESNTISVSSDTTVTSEGNTFRFKAKSRSCALVSAKPTEGAAEVNGFYACAPNVVSKTLTESYYLLGQNIGLGGSAFSDSDNATTTSWRLLIRGRKTALLLYRLVQDSTVKLVLEEPVDEQMRNELADKSIAEEFPGVLAK